MELECEFFVGGEVSKFGKSKGQEWGQVKDLEGVKGQAELKVRDRVG